MTFQSRSSAAKNGKEPPLKKNKTTLSDTTISSLPEDLVLSCLARVSRLYYPTLSLVSKRFRSLLASPELYKVRSLLNRTEACLYVCLRFSPDSDPRWFTLCEKPNRNQTNQSKRKKKKKTGYALAKIQITDSPPAHWEGVVAIGSNIYNIGGSTTLKEASSKVPILDCKSHTWHEAPSMGVKRNYATAVHVFDGKVYVIGGCEYNSSNWMEVFDPRTQSWEIVTSPVITKSVLYKSAVIEGGIYMFGEEGLVYNPKEDKWKAIGRNSELNLGWGWYCFCVIDNVLYSYSYLQGLKWYNFKIRDWVSLKGLKGLPVIRNYSCVKLVSYGGKMAVLWDKNLPCSGYHQDKMILCAVIVLEKRNEEEIWGMVELLDGVVTVPKSYKFMCAVSATL